MMRNIKKKAKVTHYLFLLIFLIEKIITNAQSIIIVHEQDYRVFLRRIIISGIQNPIIQLITITSRKLLFQKTSLITSISSNGEKKAKRQKKNTSKCFHNHIFKCKYYLLRSITSANIIK